MEPGQHTDRRTKSLSLSELVRIQDAVPVKNLGELAAPVWDSDAELDEFLADLRASRNASVG